MYQGIVTMIAFIYLFLANKISGRQLVTEIDWLVSEDQIDGLPDDCIDAFDDLHEKMSLCVWDKQTYEESPGLYINEAELRDHVQAFIDQWGLMLAELICKKID